MIINLHILPLTFSLNFIRRNIIYWLLYCVTFITELKKKDWASVNDIEKRGDKGAELFLGDIIKVADQPKKKRESE